LEEKYLYVQKKYKMNITFILGTGRSGTYLIQNILNQKNNQAYHELDFENILRLGTLKFHNKITQDEIIEYLDKEYRKILLNNVNNDIENIIDISNGLIWIVEELKLVFPQANFIYISRNGYKVVSSFYFKFKELMYDVDYSSLLIKYLNFDKKLEPPLDKRIYRPIFDFNFKMNNWRLIQLSKYWVNCENKKNKFDYIIKLKFEDIVENKNVSNDFFNLFSIYKNDFERFLYNPTNVAEPLNYIFNDDEQNIFSEICKIEMDKLNYNLKGYDVKY
jgi:hypothetical protein